MVEIADDMGGWAGGVKFAWLDCMNVAIPPAILQVVAMFHGRAMDLLQ